MRLSLNQRLLTAIATAALASLLAGAAVTGWQAVTLVRAEMRAALDAARNHTSAMLQAAPPSPAELQTLLASFEGSAHLRATLLNGTTIIARTHPVRPPYKAPRWFARLATPSLPPIELAAGTTLLRIEAEPIGEIGERWVEARFLMAILGLFSGLAALLTFAVTAWSLTPLAGLMDGFTRLARGEAGINVPQTGPPELAAAATGFNRMQEALRTAEAENKRLSAQLASLAEEERVELARDLHDEMGPLLFAITAYAATARLHAQAGAPERADAAIASLERTAADLQAKLRDLLKRLRDSAPAPLDLPAAITELLEFWRALQPAIRFELNAQTNAAQATEPARAALFRVAQEGISNAVRHAAPTRITLTLASTPHHLTLTVADNGTGGPPGAGYGLQGLRERLTALGGTLQITQHQGWALHATAPLPAPEPPCAS